MYRILIVDDAKEFQAMLYSFLREYEVQMAYTYNEAKNMLRPHQSYFDLLLLDLNLPDGNGMNILSELRQSEVYKELPIIILSNDSDILTKVTAFGIGADDYLIKPFDYAELKARISARIRSSKALINQKSHQIFGDLIIDTKKMQVRIKTKTANFIEVALTPIEYQILMMFIRRPEKVFSRESILDNVWGPGKHVTLRAVDTHVCHLRSKLCESESKIETVLNFGYKMSFTNGV